MPQNDTTRNTETDSPLVDYAFWDVPGTSTKVIYSLQLFHEIDFVVNEGYRKIPHGGIEVGGLLFGTIDSGEVRIEAFRPIDCEHASGPSLNFSERDLLQLEEQITSPVKDKEIEKFQPVGWFLAHTRGPLELTEAEAKQFDRFFPEPFKVTVLVKPERFQPTRFGFLVRTADRVMPRDAIASAIILPLPGRSHKPGQLIASIPAPAVSSAPKRPAPPMEAPPRRKPVVDDFEDEIEDTKPAPIVPPRQKPVETKPMSIWKIPPEAETDEAEVPSDETHAEHPMVDQDFRSPEERAARRQLARERTRVIEQANQSAPEPEVVPYRPPALPSLPANIARPMAGPYDLQAYGQGYPPPAYPNAVGFPIAAPPVEPESVLNSRSLTTLAVAALLGCIVGYVGYLQLPPPVIPLDIRPVNQTIVVSWPADETRNAIYAAIRFNDGAPVPLSAEEKAAGQVSLAAEKDFKVEVMTRNWMRDSRGIVRYMRSARRNDRVLPSETLPPR